MANLPFREEIKMFDELDELGMDFSEVDGLPDETHIYTFNEVVEEMKYYETHKDKRNDS